MSLTSVEVDTDSQRSARHWYQCIRFICWIEWNSSDPLMNRVKQERTHTCSETIQEVVDFSTNCIPDVQCDCCCEAASYLHMTADPS